nr:P-loop NTPase fold protein [Sphingomonas sp. CDS-1]
MSVRDNTAFSDDSPKENPWKDDALGYRAFAARAAKALVGINAPEGFVVGLHGPWGAGKSTVLNFIEAFIKKHSEEGAEGYNSISLIRFEPWIVSGHQDLIAAFFKLLSQRLADGFTAREKRKGRAGRAIRVGLDPIIDAAATLGATIDHTGGLASKSAATVAKKSVGAAIDKWLAEPSLQSTYEKLSERLSEAGHRFLVMIDDIDRLAADEIRTIMQMVKTVGRLPNVTYLLAYDRDIVWAALRDGNSVGGRTPEFAEKIIQHELELPRPSSRSLLRMLSADTAALPDAPQDSKRWMEIVHSGILRWIQRPRDVARLSNAIKFSWPALEGEIDPHDLLCMEGLRLFDRPIYNWVRDNRDMLLGEGRPRLLMDEQQQAAGARFRESLDQDDRDNIVNLLLALFPNRAKFFSGSGHYHGGELWYQVVARRGIATKAGMDAYFSLSPSATEIPKALVDFAIAHIDDQTIMESCIQDASERKDEHGNTLLGDFFQEVQYRYAGRRIAPSQALLNALINTFDLVQNIEWNGDFFTPFMQHHFLVQELLKGWSPEDAAGAVEAAVAQSKSIAAKASMVLDRARECGLVPSDGVSIEPLVDANRLTSLGSSLAADIRIAAMAGELNDLPVFYDVLRIWARFGDSEEARLWTSKIATSDGHSLAKITKGLLTHSRSSSGSHFGLKERPDPTLYDAEALHQAAGAFIGQEGLTEEDRARIAALKKGLDRMTEQDAEAATSSAETASEEDDA